MKTILVPSASAIDKEIARRNIVETESNFVLEPNFPKQNLFVEDPARFLSAQCSRRAGKSNGLALRFFRTMRKHPRSQSIYLAMTRESAKDIMWPVVQELDAKYNFRCEFIESKLEVIHPNGAKLKLYGADQKHFIKKLKGRKFPGVAVDEAQDFGTHLQSLVDDVLTPAIADYEDGWLALTGTPGPVPQGYFFDVTHGGKYGYSRHEWTLLENPFMPNPAKFIAELMEKRMWDENHPTLLREYRNKWVLDVKSLWIRYSASKNHFAALPPLPAGRKWIYILGIDIGYRDSDALAVLAWNEESKIVYLVEEVVTPKQDLTSLVEQIKAIEKKYDLVKMIIDAGGLGKKLAEEMRRRHHLPLHDADKLRKQENVELLNDALHQGRFMAHKDSQFAKDSYLIQIDWDKSTPDRIVIKKQPHSDIIDAVLYAFKESPAYAQEAPPKKPAVGSKEWAEARENDAFEQAMEHFTAQEQDASRLRTLGIPED